MANRLILWVSLAGMILTLHLWVQKARGFDQGCLGLGSQVAAPTSGCTDPEIQAASHILGVSNAAWGYAFFFALAIASFGKIACSAAWARRLHLLGEIAVAIALLYSGYLVYFQAFVAEAFCALCLSSSALVATLAVLHAALRLRGGFQPVDDATRTLELARAGGALFVGMGVLVGVMVFVNRLGTRPLDQGNARVEMRSAVGRWLPAYIDPQKLEEMRSCHFDGLRAPLDTSKIIGPKTPFLGKADGVPVVIFLDPHCSHCRQMHAIAVALAEKYSDRAKFYFLPRALWDYSIPATAALKLAEDSGKYFDLWKLEFSQPPRAQLGLEHLTSFYQQLGLDTQDLANRLEAARPQVLADRRRAAAAGIESLPAIFIDGREVFSSDTSAECLGRLLEASASAFNRSLRNRQK